MTKTTFLRPLAGALMASVFTLLAGCTNLPRNADNDAARPGVTVYGTMDGGFSRTER